jgi:hypothetical protein
VNTKRCALVVGVVLGVDDDDLAGGELLVEDLLRQRVLDVALDRPTHRTSTELRVVAQIGEQLLGGRLDLDAQTLALELLDQPLREQVDGLQHLVARQLVEHDVSSMRLRNSGRKWFFSDSLTFSFMRS